MSLSDYTSQVAQQEGLNVNASPWAGPVSFSTAFNNATPPPPPRPSPAQQVTPQQPIYCIAAQPLAGDQRPLCKFFLQGTCDRGASCQYLHELPRGSSLTDGQQGNDSTVVTGIMFNVNAKNANTTLQRQQSNSDLSGGVYTSHNGGSQIPTDVVGPEGMMDDGYGLYDAAYTPQAYQMWGDGTTEGYGDMGMYGGFDQGPNAYYGDMYTQPQQTTPPPQYHQQGHHQMAYHTQGGTAYAQPNAGTYQHVFAQSGSVQPTSQTNYWDSIPSAVPSAFNPNQNGHSTPPQQEPFRHVFHQETIPTAPQPQPPVAHVTATPTTFAATVAPTRTVQLPPSVPWGERTPTPAVISHVDAVTPAVVGTTPSKQQTSTIVSGGTSHSAPSVVRLQGSDIVSSLSKLLQDKSPPKPVGHLPDDIALAPSYSTHLAKPTAVAAPPPTTVTAPMNHPPPAPVNHTSKKGTHHVNGSTNGRGRGYGGHSYHSSNN